MADELDDVLAMPWGGERNLALRAALGLVRGEMGLVNRHQVVQVVTPRHQRARQLTSRLQSWIPDGWTVGRHRRNDGAYVIHAYDRQVDEATLALLGLG